VIITLYYWNSYLGDLSKIRVSLKGHFRYDDYKPDYSCPRLSSLFSRQSQYRE